MWVCGFVSKHSASIATTITINNMSKNNVAAVIATGNDDNTATADIVDTLKRKNPHERDARIAFDPIQHKYTIDGNVDPRAAYTSVTTWNHSHFEQFDADAVISKMMTSKNWATNVKYRGKTTDQIKAEWDSNRDQAAAAGTEMHAAIELFYNRISISSSSSSSSQREIQFQDYTATAMPEFSYFANFYRTFCKMLRPYRTEWTVFHEESRLSGSIDMVFENLDMETGEPSGTYSIYDWKRCKEITRNSSFNKWSTTPGLEHLPDTNYWHYCLQLNLYKYILQEKYGKKVSDMYLVCLHPDNANRDYQRIKVVDLQPEISTIVEARIRGLAHQ